LGVSGMRFDFSKSILKQHAFSGKPMTFFDTEPKQLLSAIIDLTAIETGNRKARENWQKAQLRNLLKHAYERSAFWRKRIGTKKISSIALSDLPILRRSDVVDQVRKEGSLLRQSDRQKVTSHLTSGSSGVPVTFFVSEVNVAYNIARSLAQYFIEGRDLSKNRTNVRPFIMSDSPNNPRLNTDGLHIAKANTWLGSLGQVFKSGHNKEILYLNPNFDALLYEMSRDDIGYLAITTPILEASLLNRDVGFLKEHNIEMLLPRGGALSIEFLNKLHSNSIKVRSNYSSEEVGLIASECEHIPGIYHIAHSNVILEAVNHHGAPLVDGKQLDRVLVTHLHSYATPFIRYDIGDLASVFDKCKCGHDGPSISNINGRSKNFIKHSDGRLTTFVVPAAELLPIVAFDEFRITQKSINTLIVELSGCENISETQREKLAHLLRARAGEEFKLELRIVDEIKWGQSIKKPAFISEVL
jgi:phenylacetate-CoA ligase